MERHHQAGLGGLTKEAIMESLPKAEKILKYHEEKKNIVIHNRPDKKVHVFAGTVWQIFSGQIGFQMFLMISTYFQIFMEFSREQF